MKWCKKVKPMLEKNKQGSETNCHILGKISANSTGTGHHWRRTRNGTVPVPRYHWQRKRNRTVPVPCYHWRRTRNGTVPVPSCHWRRKRNGTLPVLCISGGENATENYRYPVITRNGTVPVPDIIGGEK
jgi:hypothetical protein